MKSYKLAITLITILLFCACTKELPFPDVEDIPSMVVNSLFCPEDGLQVQVSESCHVQLTNCEPKSLQNAEVKLLDEAGTVLGLLEHTSDGIYTTEMAINYNANYKLEVTDLDGKLSAVSSNTYVPGKVDVVLLSLGEVKIGDRFTWGFEIEIDDDPNADNYYVLTGNFDVPRDPNIGWESEINGYSEPVFGHYTNDPNAENRRLATGTDFVPLGLRAVYLTDENFNGEKYKLTVGVVDNQLFSIGSEEITATLTVRSVSKQMFDYMISLEELRLVDVDAFGEPHKLYSNIDNGIGIFAGYSQDTLSKKLPASENWFEDIVIENEGCTAPCIVRFTAIGGAGLAYSWDFGDGTTSNLQVVEHSYETSGEYQVVFAAKGRNGEHFNDFTVKIN